jgi:hypothetical protein
MSTRALEALDRILNRGDDADDVLREVVEELVREPGIDWAGVLFLENGRLQLGPEAGLPGSASRVQTPIVFRGDPVGELAIEGRADADFLGRVATLISAHVLLGWDTRGERWEP